YDLTDLDFTQCITWQDVVDVLQARLIEVVVDADTNGFNMTSKKVGTDSTVALDAVPGGAGTNLAAAGYFNAAGGTPAAGVNSSGETICVCVARTEGDVGCVLIIPHFDLEDDVVEAVADGIQARDNMFLQQFASIQDIAGVCTTVKN